MLKQLQQQTDRHTHTHTHTDTQDNVTLAYARQGLTSISTNQEHIEVGCIGGRVERTNAHTKTHKTLTVNISSFSYSLTEKEWLP